MLSRLSGLPDNVESGPRRYTARTPATLTVDGQSTRGILDRGYPGGDRSGQDPQNAGNLGAPDTGTDQRTERTGEEERERGLFVHEFGFIRLVLV